jgi:hypothetical protein
MAFIVSKCFALDASKETDAENDSDIGILLELKVGT